MMSKTVIGIGHHVHENKSDSVSTKATILAHMDEALHTLECNL